MGRKELLSGILHINEGDMKILEEAETKLSFQVSFPIFLEVVSHQSFTNWLPCQLWKLWNLKLSQLEVTSAFFFLFYFFPFESYINNQSTHMHVVQIRDDFEWHYTLIRNDGEDNELFCSKYLLWWNYSWFIFYRVGV